MNKEQRQAFIANEFLARFRRSPTIWGRAPGRVDLMGSHTDYNQGYVMTMAVDRDTWIAASPRTDRRVHIASINLPGDREFSLDDIRHADDQALAWTDYICGVANVLQDAGYALTGFDGLIHSTIPLGSGLSSSAALEMVTAVVLQQASHFHMGAVEMAQAGQQAENQFVGVNCGILDQYSSVMERADCALLLDCRNLTNKDVPIHPDLRVVICDTKVERHLAGTEYAKRRRQCEEGVRFLQKSSLLFRRCAM
jgi:galactokinase